MPPSLPAVLPNGNVLVMGSEMEECADGCGAGVALLRQEQAEVLRLPYAFTPELR